MTETRDKIILETIWRQIFCPKPNESIKKAWSLCSVHTCESKRWKMIQRVRHIDADVEFMRAWSEKCKKFVFTSILLFFYLASTLYCHEWNSNRRWQHSCASQWINENYLSNTNSRCACMYVRIEKTHTRKLLLVKCLFRVFLHWWNICDSSQHVEYQTW